jgi:ArsR family transcriptional regulator, arsenate/arsenite/antimonite-responsive transcriptional repressor
MAMPLFEEDSEPGSSIEVRPSAVLELTWLLHLVIHAGHEPVRASGRAVLAAAADIRAELVALWGEDDCLCLPDTSILAERVGALLTDDLDPFLEGLERAARSDGPPLELRSETPADQQATRERLERLQRDPVLVRRYRDVLARVWDRARDEWEEVGRDRVRRAAGQWAERLDRGAAPLDVLPEKHILRRPQFTHLVEVRPRMVLSPLYFCKLRCGYVIDMTTYVHVGAPAEPGDPERVRREESEEVAARLKVLADGTRVALLRQLAEESLTVMDLARRFRLAQPTVSNHVRLLRDAGLLESRRQGARVLYRASPDRLDRLLTETRQVLLDRR